MIIRSIDGTGDWQFGKGIQSYKFGQNAIAENIQTRLLSFLGDCWFDLLAGIDWMRYLGSKGLQKELELRVRAMILQSYGVVRINRIDITFNRTTRNIILQYEIDTIFSSGIASILEVGNA